MRSQQRCSVAMAGLSRLRAHEQLGNHLPQLVMDHNDDTRHNFDAKDANALLKAERRFKALTVIRRGV
jgi:hypothetical protein